MLYGLPSTSRSTFTPLLHQKVRHEFMQFPVGSAHAHAMVTVLRAHMQQHNQLTSKKITSVHGWIIILLPIRKHPKPKPSHFPSRQHIQQSSRIRIMHIIIPTPMSKQIINLIKRCNRRDRSVRIPSWVQTGKRKVSLRVDRICTEEQEWRRSRWGRRQRGGMGMIS